MLESNISCLYCVSKTDLKYLFKFSLKNCLKYAKFIDHYIIVTPDTLLAEKIISHLEPQSTKYFQVIDENQYLTSAEKDLPGWCKQQIIKLKADLICKTKHILSIGADTILVTGFSLEEFLNDKDKMVVMYREHEKENNHFLFEVERIKNIRNLLGIKKKILHERFSDFIFDIFLFDSFILKDLRKYLASLYGENYFAKIFPKKVNDYKDMVVIGEWSLYSIFLIEILKKEYCLKKANAMCLQIHSIKHFDKLNQSNIHSKSIHFVNKNFDVDKLCEKLKIQ